MSTETKRTIRDREPRTATSTFTQLLSSDYLLLCNINRWLDEGRAAGNRPNEWMMQNTVGLSLLPYFVPPRLLNIFFSTLVILMLELVHLLCSAAGCTTSVAASTRKPREAKPPIVNVRHIVGNEGGECRPLVWERFPVAHLYIYCAGKPKQKLRCFSFLFSISDLILQRSCAWSKLKTSSLV